MASARIVDVFEEPSCLKGASCAFGVFDGLHFGHRFVIDRAIEAAHADGCPSVALTFDIDPDELFTEGGASKLMSNPARISLLAECGVDAVAVLPFTREFASLESVEFLDLVFLHALPASIHVGEDFRFGSHARGTVDTLLEWGAMHGMRVCPYDLLEIGGEPVTSTRIRRLIEAGNIEEAKILIGRPI